MSLSRQLWNLRRDRPGFVALSIVTVLTMVCWSASQRFGWHSIPVLFPDGIYSNLATSHRSRASLARRDELLKWSRRLFSISFR
jgi:hypothetical protein